MRNLSRDHGEQFLRNHRLERIHNPATRRLGEDPQRGRNPRLSAWRDRDQAEDGTKPLTIDRKTIIITSE